MNENVQAKERRFFQSSDAQIVLSICAACQTRRGLGLIYGKSGYGKTFALREYAMKKRVRYIECTDAMSNGDLIEAIEGKLFLSSTFGSVYKRLNRIRDYLAENPGYLLIIDEADKLVTKTTQKKLESLRYLFDGGNVGIVLAGEPVLETRIRKYLDRVANRVDCRGELKGLRSAEAMEYLSLFNISEEARKDLIERAVNRQNGCFRLLDRTLRNALDIARESGGGQITMETVKHARMMM